MTDNLLLIVIAIGIWAIWYELRYGIEKRREERKHARKYEKELVAESRVKWNEFSEARKDPEKWKEYLENNK